MKKYLLIIFLLCTPPLLWWFLPGNIVDGTDIIFPLDPILNSRRGFFAWDSVVNTGGNLYAFQVNLTKFPLYFFLSIFQFFHLPLFAINKIWYFTYLILPAIAFFLFLSELIWTNKKKYQVALIGSIFYIYNLYYLQQIFDQAITLSYIFAPLFLYLILRGLRTGKLLLHATIIGLLSFFYSPINPNSYLIGIILIISFILVLFINAIRKNDYQKSLNILKISLLAGIFSIFVCAYVFLPNYFYLRENVSGIQAESADWLTGVSRTTSFFNVIRLAGAWDWYESWNKEYYAPYAQIYTQNIFFIILSVVPAVLALLGFIYSKNKWKYYFGGLAVMGIVLAMGSHQPTGGIYFFLYDHLLGFWIFRSPWYKFSVLIVFGFAALIGLYTETLAKKLSKRKILIFFPAFFIFLSFPLFLGTRFTKPTDRHGNLASLQVEIPDYVFETSKWFNEKEGDERILMIPQIAWESTIYNWSYGNLVPPLYSLLRKNPILFLPYDRKGPGMELLKAAKLSLYTPDSTPSANYLAFLNTKYLINQKDFSYFYFRAPENSETVEKLVTMQKDFTKVKTFGKWDIYQTNNLLPRIYTTNELIKLKNIYEAGNLDIKSQPGFVLENEFEFPLEKFEKGPEIIYEEVSPVEYQIDVKALNPFYLIFLESFDRGWELNLLQNEYQHFQVNSYANGFLINKAGDYIIKLKYAPQRYFNQGWKITFISIGSLMILILVLLIKEKMLKSPKK